MIDVEIKQEVEATTSELLYEQSRWMYSMIGQRQMKCLKFWSHSIRNANICLMLFTLGDCACVCK